MVSDVDVKSCCREVPAQTTVSLRGCPRKLGHTQGWREAGRGAGGCGCRVDWAQPQREGEWRSLRISGETRHCRLEILPQRKENTNWMHRGSHPGGQRENPMAPKHSPVPQTPHRGHRGGAQSGLILTASGKGGGREEADSLGSKSLCGGVLQRWGPPHLPPHLPRGPSPMTQQQNALNALCSGNSHCRVCGDLWASWSRPGSTAGWSGSSCSCWVGRWQPGST